MNDRNRFLINSFKHINTISTLTEDQKKLILDILSVEAKDYSMCYNIPISGDFNDILELYCDSLSMDGLSFQTIKNRKYTLNELNNFLHKNITDIDVADLRSYILYKRKTIQPSTTNTIISRIEAFFTWLYEEEYIKSNPSKKLRKIKEPSRIIKAVNSVDLEKIREHCKNDRDRAIIELSVATGLRVSELRNLNVLDIDFHLNRIKIVGKGNKERVVIFTDKAKYYVLKYLKTRINQTSCELFTTLRRPYRRLGKRQIEKIVEDLRNVCEVGIKITPHSFRHTMATNMIQSGADVTTVQKLLGHNNTNTTLLYANINLDTIEQQYRKCMVG